MLGRIGQRIRKCLKKMAERTGLEPFQHTDYDGQRVTKSATWRPRPSVPGAALDRKTGQRALAALALLSAGAAHADDWIVPRTIWVGDSITVRLSAASGWTWRDVFLAAGGQYVMSPSTIAVPGAVAYLRGPATGRPQVGVVVLLLGTGDFRVQSPLPGFTHSYRRLVTSLSADARVVCVLPPPRAGEGTLPITMERYRDAIREVCPDALDPREVIPEWTPELYEDGSHPNAAGAEIYAEWLRERIAALYGGGA